jgi:hypothetical protein
MARRVSVFTRTQNPAIDAPFDYMHWIDAEDLVRRKHAAEIFRTRRGHLKSIVLLQKQYGPRQDNLFLALHAGGAPGHWFTSPVSVLETGASLVITTKQFCRSDRGASEVA